MTIEIGLVLGFTLLALGLFVTERFAVDITAIMLMVGLMLLHQLGKVPFLSGLGVDWEGTFPTIEEGLSGLSNTATVTVLCMFIISAGIARTGILERFGRAIVRYVGSSPRRQIAAIGAVIGPISGVVSNTAAVAMMLPVVTDLSKQTKVPASKLLIPLSYFAMMGGTLTLVGTSSSILAASILQAETGERLGMFSITMVGLVVLAVGLVYFVLVGIWLLPHRRTKDISKQHDQFLIELRIPPSSPLVGQSVAGSAFASGYGLTLKRIVRPGRMLEEQAEQQLLEARDVLMVVCDQATLPALMKDARVQVLFRADRALRRELETEGKIVKVLLNSPLHSRKRHFRDLDFEASHRATIVGLHQSIGEARRLGNLAVRSGQVVLMYLPKHAISRVHRDQDLVLLERVESYLDGSRTRTALVIAASVLLLSAFSPIPIVLAALLGVIAMVTTRCLPAEDVYRGVSWDIIFLLAGVIPLGITITKSGTAAWLALQIEHGVADWSPFWILFAVYLITTLLTEVVSNNAAIVILAPVGISIAESLSYSPTTFVLAILFAAGTSFLTPLGYQTNMMIYGTGIYRFQDFFRVGAPLNLILAFVTTATLAAWFPMEVPLD